MKSKLSDVQKSVPLDKVDLCLGPPRPLTDTVNTLLDLVGAARTSLDYPITAQSFILSVPYAITASQPPKLFLPYPDGLPIAMVQGTKGMSKALAQSLAVSYLRNTLDCLVQLHKVNPAVYSPSLLVSDIYHPYCTLKNPKSTAQKPGINAFMATGLVYRLKS